jgi:hypothetical protein
VFYEGDDPDGFAQEMKDEFGFDVHHPDEYGRDLWEMTVQGDDGDEWLMRQFFIPPGLVEAVYGSGRWELGS